MPKQNFNDDMGDYLSKRDKGEGSQPLRAAKRFFTKTFAFSTKDPKPKSQEPIEEDVPPEQVEAVIAEELERRPMQRAKTGKNVYRPVANTAVKPKKERTIMGWFSRNKEEDEDYEMAQVEPEQPAIDEDVKEVLKITFKWLKKMDPDTIEEIKASSDFEKYKAVLDKYGLIKK